MDQSLILKNIFKALRQISLLKKMIYNLTSNEV